mmetsp:Transcript_19208/g.54771  ORF Transcript_19208/g.54771 Transcript_19208/m.54771 type:complete len:240 (+) Transcript_19208:105-824(+)
MGAPHGDTVVRPRRRGRPLLSPRSPPREHGGANAPGCSKRKARHRLDVGRWGRGHPAPETCPTSRDGNPLRPRRSTRVAAAELPTEAARPSARSVEDDAIILIGCGVLAAALLGMRGLLRRRGHGGVCSGRRCLRPPSRLQQAGQSRRWRSGGAWRCHIGFLRLPLRRFPALPRRSRLRRFRQRRHCGIRKGYPSDWWQLRGQGVQHLHRHLRHLERGAHVQLRGVHLRSHLHVPLRRC